MKFLNIIRSLELISEKLLNQTLIEGVFIANDGAFEPPKNYLTICDKNTNHIAQKFCNVDVIRDEKTSKDIEYATKLAETLNEKDGICMFGSGSLADICKIASFIAKKPFIIYGTALSMNGYLSSTSSLIKNGLKQSFACHLPKQIYFDLEVVKNAPKEMAKAGFGDIMARSCAQSDCYLSHIAKQTKYEQKLFDLRIPSEEFMLSNYRMLLEKDDEFYLQLIENILLSGIAMHLFGSSAPASGGEHAMAHFAEQAFPEKMNKFLHGLQISGFTVEMLKIQKSFPKYPNFTIPEFDLAEIFTNLGMPNRFESLNLGKDEFEMIKTEAKHIRERYGFLNLI